MRIKLPALLCFSALVSHGKRCPFSTERLHGSSVKHLKVLKNPLVRRNPRVNALSSGSASAYQPRYRQRLFDYVNHDPKYSTQFSRPVDAADIRDLEGTLSGKFELALEHPHLFGPDLDKFIQTNDFADRINDWLAAAESFRRIAEVDLRTPEFHKIFLQKLENHTKCLSVHQAVQSLLYCANYRKISEELENSLRKIIVESANALNAKDIEVLAFSAYILKITFRGYPDFLKRVADAFVCSDTDNSSVITVLKFLRQNSFFKRSFFERVADRLRISGCGNLNAVECCHFLQSFSAAKFYDEQLFGQLQENIVENMQQQVRLYDVFPHEELMTLHPSERFRTKDMANYLYALAFVNHKITNESFVFEELLRRRQELERLPYLLVQALFALSMQGKYDTRLLEFAFSQNVSRKLAQEGWKDARRWLYCLYKNCQLEFPEGIGNIEMAEARLAAGLPKDFDKLGFELANRDQNNLENVKNILEKMYGKEAVWWGRAVPHVELSGFIVTVVSGDIVELIRNRTKGPAEVKSRKFAVEVVDSSVVCGNSDHALGLLEMKKRLLGEMGIPVKVVSERDCAKAGSFEKMLL